ncbi:MAG: amino acid/amide transporter ATP-binding protein 2, family [Rhodospirillales bacterium]|nr:amino acid/amide transporter ATP-binding protein 2, family [Rhodospirillales bacterium]
MSLLAVESLVVAHGDLVAVRDVSFNIEEGGVFVLLGANGAGKTSILRAISGLNPPRSGTIASDGRNLAGLKPHEVAAAGIAHVPEGRRVFPHLSVEDNLTVSFLVRRTNLKLAQARDNVYALFPRLAERRRQNGGTLSGGEQQMLAIGRAMMNFPRLLMLDEPSLGLSPLLAETVFERLGEISKLGLTILLVEQNAIALRLATRGLILTNGQVVLLGEVSALQDSEFVRHSYLGL